MRHLWVQVPRIRFLKTQLPKTQFPKTQFPKTRRLLLQTSQSPPRPSGLDTAFGQLR